MTLAEIKALPVRELLKDNAVVYLWATGAMREYAHAVMAAWGITYKTELVWRKVTPAGKIRMGSRKSLAIRGASCVLARSPLPDGSGSSP